MNDCVTIGNVAGFERRKIAADRFRAEFLDREIALVGSRHGEDFVFGRERARERTADESRGSGDEDTHDRVDSVRAKWRKFWAVEF